MASAKHSGGNGDFSFLFARKTSNLYSSVLKNVFVLRPIVLIDLNSISNEIFPVTMYYLQFSIALIIFQVDRKNQSDEEINRKMLLFSF